MRVAVPLAIALFVSGFHSDPAFGAPTIHRKGLITLNLSGILMPEPKANTSGPFVFKLFDLDTGLELPKDLPSADGGISVNARDATFSISAAPGMIIAVAGTSAPSFAQCVQLLKSPANNVPMSKAPTKYHCMRTTEGRVARVRINSWRAIYQPDSFVDLIVKVECRVWNP